jgi:hypothetical protein
MLPLRRIPPKHIGKEQRAPVETFKITEPALETVDSQGSSAAEASQYCKNPNPYQTHAYKMMLVRATGRTHGVAL